MGYCTSQKIRRNSTVKIIRHTTIILILLFSHILWAKNNTSIELLPGFYEAAECDIGIFINDTKGKISYQLIGKENKTKGKIVLEDNGIQFDSLYSTFYGNNDGERAYQVGGLIEDNKTFIIQNYGNSMNPYIVFDACGKYLKYKHKPTFEIFITTHKAHLYRSPNIKTKMYLIKGDKVTILDEKTDASGQKWYFINYKGKKELNMWIKAEAVDLEPQAEKMEKESLPEPAEKPKAKKPEPVTKAPTNKPAEVAQVTLTTPSPKNAEIIKAEKSEPIKSASGSPSFVLLASMFSLVVWRLS